MATPNMAAVQRSLQNCSLNSTADEVSDSPPPPPQAVELNSQSALPLHWEQCLDLKTGEIYYINWRTGMKVKEDPRRSGEEEEEEEEEEVDSESSCDDSGESSSESSPYGLRGQCSGGLYCEEKIDGNVNGKDGEEGGGDGEGDVDVEDLRMSVLVVAGCKSCLMYYMVPKRARACPNCCGQLLHFDRASSP